MKPLTEADIRGSFVNASRREGKVATLPDLATVAWDDLDFLGWRDPRRPLTAYVVMEVDGDPTGLLLRTASATRRKMLCNWCRDIVSRDDVALYVAPRAGASGRRGNTVGTAICADFGCSANARRPPTFTEMNSDDPEERQFWVDLRIAELRDRSTQFVRNLLSRTD